MNLTTATPAEIDATLADLDAKATAHRTDVIRNREAARRYTGPDATYYTEKANKALLAAQAVEAEMAPLNAEFTRRGGWTRAFIVSAGHVHSSMNCSTCNNGMYPTSFGWLTEFSGKDEAQVIEAAGSRACTVCFPNAPVDAPAGRLFHADEVAAEQARAERAAKKAIADAKKAANALPTYRTSGRWSDKIETVYAAKAFMTDGAQWGWDHPSYQPVDRDAVAALLAEKFGTTVEAQIEAAAKRAANR